MGATSFHKEKLSSGVTLVFERHPHVRAASIGLWVRVGSSYENETEAGVSHYIEHVLFKGTERRSALQISTALESLGGDLNAFTDREFTCFHATVLSEHYGVALDILSDLVLRPTFLEAEIERERKVLLQELAMVEESPEERLSEAFLSKIWKGHGLSKPVIGSRKSIQTLNRAKILGFFKKHYVPQNMVLSVAGNIDFEKLKSRCEQYFQWKKTIKPSFDERALPVFHSTKTSVVAKTEQVHLALGFKAPSFSDPKRLHALLLSFFLGGGMSSRLFQEIREKAALAYSVDCEWVPFTQAGLFSIYVGLNAKSYGKCMDILKREIMSLKEKPLDAMVVEAVKNQLKGTILLSSDQIDIRQESLGRNELVFEKYVSVENVIHELMQISAKSLWDLSQQMFVPDHEAIVVLNKNKIAVSDIGSVL